MTGVKIILVSVFSFCCLQGWAASDSVQVMSSTGTPLPAVSEDGVREITLPAGGHYLLQRNASNVDEIDDDRLIIHGSTESDHLTIDFSNGNPIPKGGLTYNGGTLHGPASVPDLDNKRADTLNVTGTNGNDTITLDQDGPFSNVIIINAGAPLSFSGIEFLNMNGGDGDDEFHIAQFTYSDLVRVNIIGDAGNDSVDIDARAGCVYDNGSTFDGAVLPAPVDYDVETASIINSETMPPTLSTCFADQALTCGVDTLPDYTSMVTVTDDCDPSPSLTQSPVPGTQITIPTLVTLTATDFNGNTNNTCSFMVSLSNPGPSLSCSGDLVVSNDSGQCGAQVFYTPPTATDNCPGVITTLTSGMASGNMFPPGTTMVSYLATDSQGATASCSFNITVNDTEPPAIPPCPDLVLAASFGCQATLPNFISAVTDNCGTPMVTQDPLPGTALGLGDTTVTIDALDAAGNPSTCQFTVTVEDQSTPTISCPNNQTFVAGPGCQISLTDLTPLAGVQDNCDANPTVSQLPIAGAPLGLGMHQVTLTAMDDAGLTASCSFGVTVNDETGPSITCPPDETYLCSEVTLMPPVVVDDCDTPLAVVLTHDAPDPFEVGSHHVTWTATDSLGNQSSCVQMITVLAEVDIDPHAVARGLWTPTFEAVIECPINLLQTLWVNLETAQVLAQNQNQLILTPTPDETTDILLRVFGDASRAELGQATGRLLVAEDPLYFDLNRDGCNTFEDWNLLLPLFGKMPPQEVTDYMGNLIQLDITPSGNDVFSVLDFFYINTENIGGCP